jgi:SMC interacting uncharacterized protein involved in chromosome segregation
MPELLLSSADCAVAQYAAAMGGENSYLKGMEEQLKLATQKVNAANIKAPLPRIEQKLEEVNTKFNTLREEDTETFEAQKLDFEKALNELSQLLNENDRP